MKVAFLDRDGTVIHDYPDLMWKYVKRPVFFEESIVTLKKLNELGYQIIFISNQYIINENIITQDQFEKINNLFLNHLKNNNVKILDFFYCPHTDDEKCNCKKPKPGLIMQALEKYPDIDMNMSIYIGDSIADVRLANLFNLKMFFICQTRIIRHIDEDIEKTICIGNIGEVINYL